ncbi:MAG: hypothetical protein GEV28_11495 [Actinophytocola sp.]|uniref:hypothetical protein n=1 Tax=Actinophytocola sp. TaxID=1872138 RepID=UPI001329AB2E|nr:hypothetical protein [Actinophytocola sp.]MPZ80980.1 hypothetical protein [Actinophytocola sp.]
MPELEDRVRGALGGLADEVPGSQNARAELDRRLGADRRARRRRPALVAAAAAVVVAAVVTPVALNQNDPTADRTRPATSGSPPPSLLEQVAGPFELGRFTTSEGPWQAVGYLQETRYCTVVVPDGAPLDGATFTCEPVPTWPSGPADSLVQSRSPINGDASHDTGPLPNRLVFLADPRVATLAARRGDGSEVAVSTLGRTDHAVAFLAEFGGSTQGFGYTARDKNGAIVEEAIT